MDLGITIISAKHLKNINWRHGDLIPSVVLHLDPSHLVSTRPDTSGSTRPVWNERFLLPLPRSSPHLLSLKIVHSENPNLLVGSLEIPIPDLNDPTRIRTFNLLRPSGRPHGKIRLKLGVILRPPAPIRDCQFAPPVSNNYNPATAPPPSPDYQFTPPVSNYYNSASAPPPPPFAPPPPPQGVPQNYNFAPPGSDNYPSATATATATACPPGMNMMPPPPAQQLLMRLPLVQNYNFTPQGSNNYTSATATTCPPGMLQQLPQNYNFTPPGSDNYTSATAPSCPPGMMPPPPPQHIPIRTPLVQNYKFTPPVSNNYASATAPAWPRVPVPPPPQQSMMRPPQKNYNLSHPGSNNYNFATASAPAYPLSPISGSMPPQQSYCYNNSYYDPYNGDKNNGLVGAMRGLALEEEEVESDMDSTIDYSEYSGSYIGRKLSTPVDDSVGFDRNRMMRGSEKLEHKTGTKESNVGMHYDYSEYRGNYGYN